jgi:enoyl-CoA hydratase/carnithine racemase
VIFRLWPVSDSRGETIFELINTDPAAAVQVETYDLPGTEAVAAGIWLNRPESLNAITDEMVTALDSALRATDAESRVCAVFISGRGRAFSAGGDLKRYLELQADPVAFPQFVDHLIEVFGSIQYMRKPVIGLVNGDAIAGGLELLVTCDFAYAAESARIGDGHLRYGQMAGAGSLTYLPRLIGPTRARELFFSARLLSAGEAFEWGLVNRVLPDSELLTAGLEFAAGVATRSPASVAQGKYAMNAGWIDGTGVPAALRLERDRAALYCLTHPDSAEGLRAFAEKRTPRFPR